MKAAAVWSSHCTAVRLSYVHYFTVYVQTRGTDTTERHNKPVTKDGGEEEGGRRARGGGGGF